ncbi:MAG: 1-phosphofructokinase family hexose kinase [Caldilineaceae bacterium]
MAATSTRPPRVLCITPNPAIDRTHIIPHLTPGAVHRSYNIVVDAGGKGINVARAVKVLGGVPLCAGFLGGLSGKMVAKLAEAEGLFPAWSWIDNETRTCVIISAEDNAESTVFNENGPSVTAAEWATLRSDVLHAARDVDAVCISGSTPSGSNSDSLPMLIDALSAVDKCVWVDTSKSALQAALSATPTAIKVNDAEAGEVAGVAIQTPAEALAVANQFCAQGIVYAIITLGRNGAVLATASSGGWWAQPPELQTVSAVASGDCFLAGLVLATCHGESPATALMHGVAAGTANALNAGGARFTKEQFEWVLAQVSLEALA